jgi:hypothetical protein
MLGEDFAAVRLDFTECDGFKSARSFKAKAKPSNAGKQIKDSELGHAATPLANTSLKSQPTSGGSLTST